MTVSEIKRQLIMSFKRAGIEAPDQVARRLMIEVMNISAVDLIINGDKRLNSSDVQSIQELAARHEGGEPLDHILGYASFYGRSFKISSDVLSPRPETEGLLTYALKALGEVSSPHILDLGTGSGAIVITLLVERDDASGLGVDISATALDMARYNAEQYLDDKRLSFIKGDWFEPVNDLFDLIVANPPYIKRGVLDELSLSVRHYDPDIALDGGEDGLSAYRQIISKAGSFLRPGGTLVVEIGYDQKEAVKHMFLQSGFKSVGSERDLANHDRIVFGKWAEPLK